MDSTVSGLYQLWERVMTTEYLLEQAMENAKERQDHESVAYLLTALKREWSKW